MSGERVPQRVVRLLRSNLLISSSDIITVVPTCLSQTGYELWLDHYSNSGVLVEIIK